MERFEREQAHPMTMDELQALIDSNSMNPCLDRLVFIETRKTERRERAIYPGYPAQIKEQNGKKSVIVFVNQCMAGHYNTACVAMAEEEIGKKCRFWSLPPTDEVMDKLPMLSDVEAQ